MSKEQTNILRHVQKWIAQNLVKLTTVQIFVMVVVIAVFVSMLLVVIIDVLWDGRISLELEVAGVIVPFLDGMFIVAILVALLNELRNKIHSSEAAIKKLVQSESEIKTLVENSPIAMIVDIGVGVDEEVTMMNQKFTELFGYTIKDIPNVHHWWILAYPDETLRKKVSLEWTEKANKAIQSNFKTEPVETTIACKDGSIRYVRVSLSSVGARNIITFEDLTKNKKVEESLIKLSLAVEQSPSSIEITDINGNIEYVNAKFIDETGYSLAEVVGQNPRILQSGKTPRATYDDMWAHLTRGESWKGEVINRRKDGSEYTELALISPVRQADGTIMNYIAIKENVTEIRKKDEELRRLLDSMEEGAYGVGLDGDITFINRAFLQILGYENKDEVLGKHAHHLFHYSHRDGSAYQDNECRSYLAYRSNQSTNISDEVFWKKDGTAIPVEYWSRPILSNGIVVGGITTFVDITERKQAEINLKRSSNLYATLSQCNKAIVYSNNKEELFMQICRAAVESSGFKMAWIGSVNKEQQQIISVASYGDTDGYLEDIQVSMDASDPLGRGPTGTAIRESKPFWCQDFLHDPRTLPWHEIGVRSGWKSSAALPLYQKGDTVGALTIYSGEVDAFDESAQNLLTEMATDVSYALDAFVDKAERKEMIKTMKSHEVSLAELNKFLLIEKKGVEEAKIKDEALLSSLGEGMISVNVEGKILSMNRMAEKLLGWSEAEVLGKIATDIILAVDELGGPINAENRICSMVASGKAKETLMGPTYLINKDGDKVPVMETATPVIIDGVNTGAVVIFRDTTEEKEIEKTREDLLTLASHQLRTPLSGTKWLIETLQSGLKGDLNNDQKEYLAEIYKINERMTTLVVDMLGVLRMEGGAIALNKSKISTTALLDAIFETFNPVAKSRSLTLRIEKGGEHTIETDPLLLRNIIESFISNALNYSNIGGEVILSAKEEKEGIVFTIKDSGIGIPKNEQSQLFERFYRASNAKIFNTRGTGLGLYIAATLAKKIGAKLSLESEEGVGSTFYVHIPFLTPEMLPEYTTRVYN